MLILPPVHLPVIDLSPGICSHVRMKKSKERRRRRISKQTFTSFRRQRHLLIIEVATLSRKAALHEDICQLTDVDIDSCYNSSEQITFGSSRPSRAEHWRLYRNCGFIADEESSALYSFATATGACDVQIKSDATVQLLTSTREPDVEIKDGTAILKREQDHISRTALTVRLLKSTREQGIETEDGTAILKREQSARLFWANGPGHISRTALTVRLLKSTREQGIETEDGTAILKREQSTRLFWANGPDHISRTALTVRLLKSTREQGIETEDSTAILKREQSARLFWANGPDHISRTALTVRLLKSIREQGIETEDEEDLLIRYEVKYKFELVIDHLQPEETGLELDTSAESPPPTSWNSPPSPSSVAA
ncbi:hypothetical protein J6590_081987 [Homalodisca vitripennis]|nr:hypothetical protein J6590_081987 [Homalodisca vitripennis]